MHFSRICIGRIDMSSTKQALSDLCLLFLLSILAYGFFLGSYHLIVPDEGRYVEVAREMIASHNFITPYLDGTTFLDKPILYYWIESFFIKLFGLNEWSARLLPLLFATLGNLFIFWAGLKLYSRRIAWIASLTLMSSLLYFLSAHYADMDLMVAVLLSGSFWSFIIGIERHDKTRTPYLWSAYIFAGLAFLTKGLMGLVFPCMVIGLWIILHWRWTTLLRMRILSGLALFLFILLPWFILVQQANDEFFHYFFVIQQFARYTTQNFNMHKPVYFYLIVIFAGLFPWSLFLPQALFSFIKKIRASWGTSDTETFILLWATLIFIFFTLPKSKIVGYILPVFPPLAMMIAVYLDHHWELLPKSRSLKICSFIFLFIAVIGSLALIITSRHPSLTTPETLINFTLIGLILISGACLTVFYSFYSESFSKTFFALFCTSLLVGMMAIMSASTFKLSTIKPLALYLRTILPKNAIVISYRSYYQDLPVYLNQKVYVVYNWDDPSIAANDNWRRELAEDILYKHYHQPYLIGDNELSSLWKQQALYIVMDQGKYATLAPMLTPPIYILKKYDKFMVVSNQKP